MPSFARACGARQRDGVLWGAKGAQRLSLPTTHHLSMMPQSRASEEVCCVMGKICPAPFAPHNAPSIHDATEPAREYVVLWGKSVPRLSLPTTHHLSMMLRSQ